ncbi:MAG: hypothetical protein ACJ79W_11145 [Myxococcales bacterium]
MQIGEILIEQGHLTREGLGEALDWQVLYGGRLGTNLLELRLCEEEQLARGLAKQHGCEVTWGNLEVDPALVVLVPAHVAQRDEMVPWKIERRRLKVLVTRIDPGKLDDLSYKLGKPCVPVVAPEFRVINLLRAHYGAMRQMRALDFGVVPEEGRLARRKQKAEAAGAKAAPAELIDEKSFSEIYNQVLAGKPTPAPTSAESSSHRAPAPLEPWPEEPASRAPAGSGRAGSEKPAAEPSPGPKRPAEPSSGRKRPAESAAEQTAASSAAEEPTEKVMSGPSIEALPEDAIIGEVIPTPQASARVAPTGWDTPPPAQPPADDSPLPFEKALELLRTVQDRDAIARIVLRASRSKAERALLLLVQGAVVLGWDGLGEGLENGAAGRIAVPLGVPSAFDLVVKTRSHFLGPLRKTPLNIRFLAQTGKKVPLSSLVVPILHRERVSHILYLDNGHKKQAPTDVGEMLILTQRIAQSVDALVDKRKAGLT